MAIDRDEKLIRNAFSQIKVDTRYLKRKVEEDMKFCDMVKPTPRKRAGLFIAASLAVFILLGGTVYAAAVGLGPFDRFMIDHDPAFGEIVEPVEIYKISHGLRLEVIAAQQFGSNALLYVSVQDISGQNRITAYSSMFADRPRHEPLDDGAELRVIHMGGSTELIYFDEETNTAYFQMEFQQDIAGSGEIELVINEFTFYRGSIAIDFPIQLSHLTQAPTLPFTTWNSDLNKILKPSGPGMFPGLQSGGTDWISGAAIIDDNLHVQLGASGDSSPMMLTLTTPNGEMVSPIDQIWVLAGQDFQPLEDQVLSGDRTDQIPYRLAEVVYPLNMNALDDYTAQVLGMVHDYVQVNWEVLIPTSDTTNLIRGWEGAKQYRDITFESVSLTPLGVRFAGSKENMYSIMVLMGADNAGHIAVYVETAAGTIALQEHPSIGVSMCPNIPAYIWDEPAREDLVIPAVFHGFARAASPIDVESATAVIINGIRIPLR